MKREHVIDSYQAWDDDRLGSQERRSIQQHLDDCDDCRRYYDRMSQLLEARDPSLLPRLEPDPYLSTRVRALAEKKHSAPARGRAFALVRVLLSSMMLVVAASVGVYLGKALSVETQRTGDTEIINAYYDAFSQQGFESEWEGLFENGEEEEGS